MSDDVGNVFHVLFFCHLYILFGEMSLMSFAHFLIVFFFLFLAMPYGSRILVPNRGLNVHPLQWKCRVLTTGPPGKSLYCLFLYYWILTFFIYPKYEFFVRLVVWNYFLPLCRLSFHPFSRVFHRTKYLIQMKSLISTTLFSNSLIHSSVSCNILLIPSSVFFISVFVFFSLVNSLYFLFVKIPLCSSTLLLISLTIFMIMIITLISLSCRRLILAV